MSNPQKLTSSYKKGKTKLMQLSDTYRDNVWYIVGEKMKQKLCNWLMQLSSSFWGKYGYTWFQKKPKSKIKSPTDFERRGIWIWKIYCINFVKFGS